MTVMILPKLILFNTIMNSKLVSRYAEQFLNLLCQFNSGGNVFELYDLAQQPGVRYFDVKNDVNVESIANMVPIFMTLHTCRLLVGRVKYWVDSISAWTVRLRLAKGQYLLSG